MRSALLTLAAIPIAWWASLRIRRARRRRTWARQWAIRRREIDARSRGWDERGK